MKRLVLSIAGVLATAPLLLLISGCQTSAVNVSDADKAYQLLNEVLDHWKAGRSVDDVRTSTPPIYVSDDMWQSSFELKEFTIVGPGEKYGTNVRLRAKLRCVGEKGKSVDTEVRYLVTTTPALTVAREDR